MRHLPRVQVYYAMKANPDPVIVKTFYDAGASFDVASLQEFTTVYNLISGMPSKDKQDFIWNKIIYANPVKRIATLIELDQYKPLVTFDNSAEIGDIVYAENIGAYSHASSTWFNGFPPAKTIHINA
jgi:ornithine decarboxylase